MSAPIEKSHSKNDLIDLINTLDLRVVFSHQDNKKSIQDKLIELLQNKELQKPFKVENVYKIKTYADLRMYLKSKNPKKSLSVKEKGDIMRICKHVISFCNVGYNLNLSNHYNTKQEIIDDMNYIKQFGDIPSVRRACKLINKYEKVEDQFIPIISPQIQRKLQDKVYTQQTIAGKLRVKRGEIIVSFD